MAPDRGEPGRGEPSRRQFLAGAAGIGGALGAGPALGRLPRPGRQGDAGGPVMVGSANALAGMRESWPRLTDGMAPLDAAIECVKVVEADPNDTSVGLGGLPNEEGRVALDAACMDGATHNGGGVAAIENILHPSEVARLVMERTDHCLLVGSGAYDFARAHGHPHAELLTERARETWLRWKETMSDIDDRLPPPPEEEDEHGALERPGDAPRVGSIDFRDFPRHGTVHCSVRATGGDLACTTTTSGLAFKVPGRVGDSPLIGSGLYLDQEAGSAGATGRGEAAILAHGSSAIVELMRQGASPQEAGLEVLRRIVRQVERQASWQPGLLDGDGRPSFGLHFYVLATDGRFAGVTLKDAGKSFAVADREGGPRLEPLVALLD